MPTWLRLFHINKISEHNKEQNEKMEKAQNKGKSTSTSPSRPNINPSSTYDF